MDLFSLHLGTMIPFLPLRSESGLVCCQPASGSKTKWIWTELWTVTTESDKVMVVQVTGQSLALKSCIWYLSKGALVSFILYNQPFRVASVCCVSALLQIHLGHSEQASVCLTGNRDCWCSMVFRLWGARGWIQEEFCDSFCPVVGAFETLNFRITKYFHKSILIWLL